MSYYILPKNINEINVNPQYSDELCKPYISYSLLNYYSQIKQQIIDMFSFDIDLSDNSFDCAIKVINPYEFIFSKVPGSKFSVSKLKPKTNIFYDLLEISSNLNIFETFKTNQKLTFFHVSPNYYDSIQCFEELFREGFYDEHIFIDNCNLDNISDNKIDFLFYETNMSDYFITFIQAILIILKCQKTNGISIIKISDIFYKPICLNT